jgi:hypothetical protein
VRTHGAELRAAGWDPRARCYENNSQPSDNNKLHHPVAHQLLAGVTALSVLRAGKISVKIF